MRYRIEHLKDNTYQVFERNRVEWDDDLDGFVYSGWEDNPTFQGSLPDCEAYIRLKQDPDIDF